MSNWFTDDIASGEWQCWAPITVASFGASCAFHHGQQYLTAVREAEQAELALQQAESEAAAAAVAAGMAESQKQEMMTRLSGTLLQMLPVGIAIGTVGLGFVGYMWWRSRNR